MTDLRLISVVDGNLAIDFARVYLPEVILMDINLPGISGLEAMKILRSYPLTAHIPIIAISANALPQDIENAIKEIAIEPNEDDKHDDNRKKKYETSHISDVTNQVEIWTRVTHNEEYIKIIIKDGKVIGALLIGDTNLEEVFENLILNQLDVSALGADILNPDIDIEDYFD
jgi:CheY-like chemotaxis protein